MISYFYEKSSVAGQTRAMVSRWPSWPVCRILSSSGPKELADQLLGMPMITVAGAGILSQQKHSATTRKSRFIYDEVDLDTDVPYLTLSRTTIF